MASAYLPISFLKQTPLLEKQLRIFLSYLPQEPLKEYLYNADICIGKRNMSKIDLIYVIITEKILKTVYSQEDDDLSKEKANELLKKKISPKIKAKPKLLNNLTLIQFMIKNISMPLSLINNNLLTKPKHKFSSLSVHKNL